MRQEETGTVPLDEALGEIPVKKPAWWELWKWPRLENRLVGFWQSDPEFPNPLETAGSWAEAATLRGAWECQQPNLQRHRWPDQAAELGQNLLQCFVPAPSDGADPASMTSTLYHCTRPFFPSFFVPLDIVHMAALDL